MRFTILSLVRYLTMSRNFLVVLHMDFMDIYCMVETYSDLTDILMR